MSPKYCRRVCFGTLAVLGVAICALWTVRDKLGDVNRLPGTHNARVVDVATSRPSWLGGRSHPPDSSDNILHRVPPWPYAGESTAIDWDRAIEVACWIQHSDMHTVERTIDDYLGSIDSPTRRLSPGALDRESRVYLVLRVAFALPCIAPEDAKNFWLSRRAEESGLIDMSWPIRWTERGPELVGYIDQAHPSYDAIREYRHFLQNYPQRRLPCGSGDRADSK